MDTPGYAEEVWTLATPAAPVPPSVRTQRPWKGSESHFCGLKILPEPGVDSTDLTVDSAGPTPTRINGLLGLSVTGAKPRG